MELHIKEAREGVGYSQKELAQIIGVAQNTFHGYESGKHDPKSDLLIKIAEACGVSVDFLLGREQMEQQKTPPSAEDSAPEGEKVSFEELHQLLVALGFVRDGQDLSDEDLAFLTHIIGLLDAWFSENH